MPGEEEMNPTAAEAEEEAKEADLEAPAPSENELEETKKIEAMIMESGGEIAMTSQNAPKAIHQGTERSVALATEPADNNGCCPLPQTAEELFEEKFLISAEIRPREQVQFFWRIPVVRL